MGFGAWGIGHSWWGPTDDTVSRKALRRAWELGITFYDTAYVYGDGHSERLIGALLKDIGGSGPSAFVATKIPPKNWRWPADAHTPLRDAFPRDWILSCTERSLMNLEIETIPLQQLHVWTDAWVEEQEWQEAVTRLKKQGKILFFGVSVNDHQPESALKLVASGLVDAIQVIYNIFEQSPEKELFPLCQKKGVAVIARVPLDEGSLTGTLTPSTVFPEGDFRREYFGQGRLQEVCRRVDRLRTLLDSSVATLPELALRFCLSHPAVSSVIPGMRKPDHVEANAGIADRGSLAPDLLLNLKAFHWPRNFYR